MEEMNLTEGSTSPLVNRKRGKRGATKKPSYMADGQFFCGVCESPNPTGYHYGKITCEGCKGFFKRVVQVNRGSSLKCRNNGQCLDDGQRGLRKCASCRYTKCLNIGMDPELVKVGNTLVAWNQKKHDNRKKRESLKRTTSDSNEDLSMCFQESSTEESLNSGRSFNRSSLGFETESPRSVETITRRGRKTKRYHRGTAIDDDDDDDDDVKQRYHVDPGVNAFLHFTRLSCNNGRGSDATVGDDNDDVLVESKDDHRDDDDDGELLVESIINNFKRIFKEQKEKPICRCNDKKDAEEMLRSCIYRNSWSEFFLSFEELCQLDESVISETVLESVTACQTLVTMATGSTPDGTTLNLENDSEIMVVDEKVIDQSMVLKGILMTSQTSVIRSMNIDDVALVSMLIAVNLGKEISERNDSKSSTQRLNQIQILISNHLKQKNPNEPKSYEIYQDLMSICIMISCHVDKMLES